MLFRGEKFFILFFISFLWVIGLAILYPLWLLSSSYPSLFSCTILLLILIYFLFKIKKKLSVYSFKVLFNLIISVVKWVAIIFLVLIGVTALSLNFFLSLLFFSLALFLVFFRVPCKYEKI